MFKQAVLCVLIAFSLAACGGDDSNSTAPATSADTVPPPPPVDTAPTLSGVPPASVIAGSAYLFAPEAADANNDALTFSIANMPSWGSFDVATGKLSGTPTTADVGVATAISISVSDGAQTASIGPFNITVIAPATPSNPAPKNTPPVISGTPATTVVVGQAYNFSPTASDADSDTLSFTIANKPSWATFSSTTGKLSGTPATANIKTYSNIVISVSDGKVNASLPAFSVQVTAPANHAPQISGTPAASDVAGTAYSFQPSASDVDGNKLTFAIKNKPTWAAFSTTTGLLSGTPTSAQAGAYSGIAISVSDGTTSVSLPTFAITVSTTGGGTTPPANTAPTISGTPSTSVTVGASYSFMPSAADANGDALTFSIQNKPSWASFATGSGALSGTPAAGDVGTSSNIVISVSDGKASTALPSFNVVVNAAGSSNGTATVSWLPPTQNSDGSALMDLAGFKVYYGTSSTNLNQSVQVAGTAMTSYTITSLSSGTWTFAVAAYNSSGAESSLSNAGAKTIP